MDVVVLFNGLGNQMSQYSLYLQKKNNGENVTFICVNNDHNGIEIDSVFGVNCKMKLKQLFLFQLYRILVVDKKSIVLTVIRILLNTLRIRVVDENYNYSFQDVYFNPSNHGIRFLKGGWHNPAYFQNISYDIKEIFHFSHINDSKNVELISLLHKPNAVCVHIRKGDYLLGKNLDIFGSVCNEEYYNKAFEYVESVIMDPSYFVFSNDLQWAKSLMKDRTSIFIDWNDKDNSWKDMCLMSQCSNIIIANSTFSWWAAWLCLHPKVIVCPRYFVYNDISSDIYLKTWHKIE